MSFHRFFVLPNSIKSNRVFIPKETSKQITKVLRLKKGDQIVVLDGMGNEYLVALDQMIWDNVSGKILSKKINLSEPKTQITLYQALTPREKFETVLQKGTEIGVSSFVPTETKRSLLKVNDAKKEKLERWQRIVQEASEQSERGIIPAVKEPIRFQEAVKLALEEGIVLIAWENEEKNTLAKVLSGISAHKISIFIGPEGGFEESEIEFAKSSGATTVSLGPRILRTETAGPFLGSLILFSKGALEEKRA